MTAERLEELRADSRDRLFRRVIGTNAIGIIDELLAYVDELRELIGRMPDNTCYCYEPKPGIVIHRTSCQFADKCMLLDFRLPEGHTMEKK